MVLNHLMNAQLSPKSQNLISRQKFYIGSNMGKHCCEHKLENLEGKNKFKKALYFALVINLAMFILEIVQGMASKSLSLKADAIDFLGDSINYAISLFVISASLGTRAKVSLLKALSMFLFGMWVLFEAGISFNTDHVPNSFTMSWVGALALLSNMLVAFVLYKFREGDSNMQSVWLCSRNDAIGNLAVVIASFGVFYFKSKWPDLIVATAMAYLSISASLTILKSAKNELQTL